MKNIKNTTIYSKINNVFKNIGENEKSKKLFKDIRNLIFIFGFTFLFLILWVNRVNLSPGNVILYANGKFCSFGVGQGFPYTFDGTKIATENLKVHDGNIFALSDTSFEIINSSGKLVRKVKHKFSNPCLKISGVRQLIYDIGGKNLKIESCSGSIYDKETEKEIITAAISDSGTYGIVTRSITHNAELNVYNKNNIEKYKYRFSDCHVTDMVLSSDGKEGLISAISAQNGEIVSTIYILDFKSEIPKAQFKLENNMVTDVEYLPNGKFAAIGDKYMSFINIKSKTTENYFYNEKILKFYEINKEHGVYCCMSSSANKSDDELIFVNTSGKKTYEVKIPENLIGISWRKNKIAGLSSDKILSLNENGKLNGYIKTKHHDKKVILLPGSNAYVLHSEAIDKIKINNLEKYK
ncbi:MAG: hypothetical protein IJG00_04600 [Clostridia bacterium]|nr:hypothetical protein [Clostridia bacterium]